MFGPGQDDALEGLLGGKMKGSKSKRLAPVLGNSVFVRRTWLETRERGVLQGEEAVVTKRRVRKQGAKRALDALHRPLERLRLWHVGGKWASSLHSAGLCRLEEESPSYIGCGMATQVTIALQIWSIAIMRGSWKSMDVQE